MPTPENEGNARMWLGVYGGCTAYAAWHGSYWLAALFAIFTASFLPLRFWVATGRFFGLRN